MARAKEACMVCFEFPCVCEDNKRNIRKPTTKARDIKTISAPILEAPKTIARPGVNSDKVLMTYAIQNLESLLHPSEVVEHSEELKHEFSVDELRVLMERVE